MTRSGCRILYCHCAYAQVVPPQVKGEVLAGLTASERSFDAVPDLCEMSARRDPDLARLAAAGGAVIVACYPRAVRWLFDAANVSLPDGTRVLNMREDTADQVLRAIDEAAGANEEDVVNGGSQ